MKEISEILWLIKYLSYTQNFHHQQWSLMPWLREAFLVFFLREGGIFLFLFYVSFLATRMAWRILIPPPGMEPVLPAVEAQCSNQWATREILGGVFKEKKNQVILITCSTLPNLL